MTCERLFLKHYSRYGWLSPKKDLQSPCRCLQVVHPSPVLTLRHPRDYAMRSFRSASPFKPMEMPSRSLGITIVGQPSALYRF